MIGLIGSLLLGFFIGIVIATVLQKVFNSLFFQTLCILGLIGLVVLINFTIFITVADEQCVQRNMTMTDNSFLNLAIECNNNTMIKEHCEKIGQYSKWGNYVGEKETCVWS